MPSNQTDSSFRSRVEMYVRQIPKGCVTTYGDLAALAGSPAASRIVGGIAHYGDPRLPWHRVVNRHGGLARGYPGGMEAQAKHLEADGVAVVGYVVKNFQEKRWNPYR